MLQLQKELNEENKVIMGLAYELYKKHGFHDGNAFIDWLEVERQTGKQYRLKRNKQMRNILLAIAGILCVIASILFITMFTKSPEVELSEKSLAALRVMAIVLDPKADEKVVVFGDTHFDFDRFSLTREAKRQLDQNVRILRQNPKTNVRVAGYTSAQGTEYVNQKLSENRANAVRNYLIEEGIAPERITTIGYGRTKPAVYEVNPDDINTNEAKANMRVLFEVVVK